MREAISIAGGPETRPDSQGPETPPRHSVHAPLVTAVTKGIEFISQPVKGIDFFSSLLKFAC